jgi:hypothetical protein
MPDSDSADLLSPSARARLERFRHRWGRAVALVAVAAAGLGFGAAGPLMISPLARLTGADRPHGEAAEALAELPVREGSSPALTDDPFGLRSMAGRKSASARTTASAAPSGSQDRSGSDYSRDAFAYQQIDSDGDGCTIREDILRRDLRSIRHATPGSGTPSCTILSGRLADPYTGTTIAFRRGRATSSRIQIDHVVALHNAWDSGASGWTAAKRRALGNDPQNLLAVSGPANQEKSDADASQWLPSNTRFRCEYVARQIGVKQAYGLSVTAAETNAMRTQLAQCPSQPLVTHYPRARTVDARPQRWPEDTHDEG